MIPPNLRRLSDTELAAIRDRVTSPVKLSDERLRAIALIMLEYQRRGHSSTALAYLRRNKSRSGFMSPDLDDE
jgi:hypothetical protein